MAPKVQLGPLATLSVEHQPREIPVDPGPTQRSYSQVDPLEVDLRSLESGSEVGCHGVQRNVKYSTGQSSLTNPSRATTSAVNPCASNRCRR